MSLPFIDAGGGGSTGGYRPRIYTQKTRGSGIQYPVAEDPFTGAPIPLDEAIRMVTGESGPILPPPPSEVIPTQPVLPPALTTTTTPIVEPIVEEEVAVDEPPPPELPPVDDGGGFIPPPPPIVTPPPPPPLPQPQDITGYVPQARAGLQDLVGATPSQRPISPSFRPPLPSGGAFRPQTPAFFRGLQRSPFARFAMRDGSSLFSQLGFPRFEDPQLPPLEDEERRRREMQAISAVLP